MINSAINQLLNNKNLDETTIYEVFEEILSGVSDSIKTTSFVSILKAKEETLDEIFYSILASKNFIKKINLNANKENLIENINLSYCETILDISFAVDIICAANDLGALKYSFDSDKSFRTLKFFCNNQESMLENFERLSFAYFLLDKQEPYYKYSSQVSKRLPFETIFSLIDNFLNPYQVGNQMIGVNKIELVEKIASLCLKLKNFNSLVVSAKNNLPFVSVEGDSFVAEAWKDKIFTYTLNPELLGFKSFSIDEIKCENPKDGAVIIEKVFENKIKGAPYCAFIINSALALYISKKAPSIVDGIELAKKTIDSGIALEKLEQIKNTFLT